MKDKEINITLSTKELRESLQGIINSPHAKAMAEVIISNLAITEIGLEQLYKAQMLGKVPTSIYKKGDKVWLPSGNLTSWRMDLEAMRVQNLIFKDLVLCTITEVNYERRANLSITYPYIDKTTKELLQETYSVDEKYVIIPEDPI